MNILICDPVGESGINFLIKQGHSVSYKPEITESDLLKEISGADALIVRSRTKVTSEIIDASFNLRVIGRSGAGVDNIDVASCMAKKITVVNAPGANTQSVAEHTMALILALARDIVRASSSMSAGIWSKSTYRGMELHGKTLGIVGYGHIGSYVAKLARAFGMNILVYSKSKNSARSAEIAHIGGKEVSFDTLLQESEFVTVHVSLSQDTMGMFGIAAFSKMKPISYLINTSRGKVVNESALMDALNSGGIAGAALDVFAVEPLPENSPLCSMNNVILTPHIAANSREADERATQMIAEDIDRVLKGETAVHAV